jgi:glycosyltransferase 2 family protein
MDDICAEGYGSIEMVDDQETHLNPTQTEPQQHAAPMPRRSRKTVILVVKIVFMAVVLGWIGRAFFKAWQQVQAEHIAIDWRWAPVTIICFCGSILMAALVWLRLGRRMGDRSPTLPLLGAYAFSQMGKYVPGKVFLLLMRIQRSTRVGMRPQTCTLSTIVENALYMVSGGLVGMTAIVHIVAGLEGDAAAFRPMIWPATIALVLALLAACYPPVFYTLVNRILRGMKKPEVPKAEQMGLGTFSLAIIGFLPCWLLGGLALWATTQCVHAVPIADAWWFSGAFALSVIIGMASFLPGGAGIREAVIGAAVLMELRDSMPNHPKALVLAGIVAILLRIFQLIAELMLGIVGGFLTTKRSQTLVQTQ